MSIERLDVGKRMSQTVIHGDTVYLAGQVAQTPAASRSPSRPRTSWPRSTGCWRRPGPTRSKLLTANDLARRHRDLR